MKKVSTAATKRNRNFSQPNLTIGLDLGDRSSCYCVLDETGRIVMEQKVSTTAKALQAAPVTRTPNLHRANSDRSPRVRMEGWRQWRLGRGKNRVQRKNKRIDLTPTGLLMEGHYTQDPLVPVVMPKT